VDIDSRVRWRRPAIKRKRWTFVFDFAFRVEAFFVFGGSLGNRSASQSERGKVERENKKKTAHKQQQQQQQQQYRKKRHPNQVTWLRLSIETQSVFKDDKNSVKTSKLSKIDA